MADIHLTDTERSAVMCAAMDCGPCQQGTWDVEGCHCAEDLSQAVERIVAARLAAQREAIANAIEDAYLGPDAGRSPINGTESPYAREYEAYDEGLQNAARIVREFGTEQP